MRSTRLPSLTRERWETADGDFVDLDWLIGPPTSPLVLILHGLEGSSKSSYVAELFRGIQRNGWSGVALNFRSCSGEPNRLLRSYHSGETLDARFVISRLRQRWRGPLFAVGFSLGGNVLLRLLASDGNRSGLDAAVAICVPFNLSACAQTLDGQTRWMPAYRRHFLRSLRRKAIQKARRHRGTLDVQQVRSCATIRAFDELVTAPLHGFQNAEHYYAQCSSDSAVESISTPTLIISAKDDPMVRTPVPVEAFRNPWIRVLQTEGGGHVGFVSGSWWRPVYWAERQALHFLGHFLPTG
jgi:predicted alpha/beta-fold hydrolase